MGRCYTSVRSDAFAANTVQNSANFSMRNLLPFLFKLKIKCIRCKIKQFYMYDAGTPNPSHHTVSGHYWPISEIGGPIVTRFDMLVGV